MVGYSTSSTSLPSEAFSALPLSCPPSTTLSSTSPRFRPAASPFLQLLPARSLGSRRLVRRPRRWNYHSLRRLSDRHRRTLRADDHSSLIATTLLFMLCFAALGAGNGATFQLVPLRWPLTTAVAGGMIGEIGALGGGILLTCWDNPNSTLAPIARASCCMPCSQSEY